MAGNSPKAHPGHREAVRKLQDQLQDLKAQADEDDRRLAAFQKKHGILLPPRRF